MIKNSLITTKASQDTDLPVKISKENADYFPEFNYTQFNGSVRSSQFSISFLLTAIISIFKSKSRNQEYNCLLAYYLQFQRFLKKLWRNNFWYILKIFLQISVLVSVSVPNTVFGTLLTDLSKKSYYICHEFVNHQMKCL